MVREFTPAGEIIEVLIKQTNEPLEDRDIRWVLGHITSLITLPPQPAQPGIEPEVKRPKFSWVGAALLLVIVVLLVALFDDLPL
jgi:hypothetical protein